MATVADGRYNGSLLEPQTQALKLADQQVRRGFVRKVYGILTVQLLLTIAVSFPIMKMGPVWVQAHQGLVWLSMAGSMAAVCSFICCRDAVKSFPKNYILLFVFTVFEAILVGCIASMYTPRSVLMVMGMTATIFAGMTLFACTTKRDFTGMGPYLMGFLTCMLAVGAFTLLLSAMGVHISVVETGYSFLCVLLFTMYLVWDTQMIIGGNHECKFDVDEYVLAALQIYMDIINIFINLLQLFGDRN